jgi:hypothetical protein
MFLRVHLRAEVNGMQIATREQQGLPAVEHFPTGQVVSDVLAKPKTPVP